MTEADLRRLHYAAHAFEATNLDGNVALPQRFLRIVNDEIVRLRGMTLDEFTDWCEARPVEAIAARRPK